MYAGARGRLRMGLVPCQSRGLAMFCITRFIRTETTRANADYMDGFTDGSMTHLTGEIGHRTDVLTQKFNDLMRENPEFYKAMYNYTVLNKNYDKALAEYKEMDKGFFARLFGPTGLMLVIVSCYLNG